MFSKGTTLSWNGHAVAKLNSIGTPELSIDSRDITTHDSSGYLREFAAGLADPGSVPITGYFDATDTAGQQAMFTDASNRQTRQVVITGPSSGWTITFNAFITAIKLIGESPVDGEIPFSATLKVTGVPVYAVSAVVGMSACGFSNDVLMMPTFDIAEFEYVVTITHGETSTIITPVDGTSGEIITITANGVSQTVATGVASSAIALTADEINDIVITISKAGTASKVYTFHCAVLAA
jgi:predicted secreted protein